MNIFKIRILKNKRPTREDYELALLEAGAREIPETCEVFLKTEFDESNKIRFLVAAFRLIELFGVARERKFQKIIDALNEDIDESIRSDSADVMNEIGARNAIIDNKELIFRLSENMYPILKKAKRLLVQQRFTKGGTRIMSPIQLFVAFFPSK